MALVYGEKTAGKGAALPRHDAAGTGESPPAAFRFFLSIAFRSSVAVIVSLFLLLHSPRFIEAENNTWKQVDEGLSVAEFESPLKSEAGDSRITAVRIDPRFYAFKLLCSSEYGKKKRTVEEWCTEFHLVAAVNAGMFQENGFTSVGYMRNYNHVNNPRFGRDNTVLAFNPVEAGLPEVQIIDRECQDLDSLKRKYNTLVQSIRMISCGGQNVWSQQQGKWSIVAIAMDENGRVLFLSARSPYSVHDFIEILQSLPLSIKNAMYLEGGPQASLFLSSGDFKVEKYGSMETGFDDAGALQFALPIPNVIGIVKRNSE
ncbi:MAG: phosphodiester glycosidase family protein [Syntrophobacteraceae bacterium]